MIEYVRGFVRKYLCTERDALLASLMDGVRASGNQEVHVQMIPTKRGYFLSLTLIFLSFKLTLIGVLIQFIMCILIYSN